MRILAFNDVAVSEPGVILEVTTLPPTVPEPPRNLNVVVSVPYAASLAWQSPSDEKGRPVLGYHIAVAKGVGGSLNFVDQAQ